MPCFFRVHLTTQEIIAAPKYAHGRYLADAKIDLIGGAEAYELRTCDFFLERWGLSWFGHFEAVGRWPKGDNSPETGAAYLCLHNLTILRDDYPPHGQPFEVGDRFEMSKNGKSIGACVITLLPNYRDSVQLDAPHDPPRMGLSTTPWVEVPRPSE